MGICDICKHILHTLHMSHMSHMFISTFLKYIFDDF